MESNEKEADELKDIAPGLASARGMHPFRVPENYFDDLEGKILASIRNDSLKSVKITRGSRIFRLRKMWWAAASVILIAMITFSVLREPSSVSTLTSGIDTGYILLENAAELPDAMVVALYEEQFSAVAVPTNGEINYLLEAADLDPELLNSL